MFGLELVFLLLFIASFFSNGKIVVKAVNCILNKPGVSTLKVHLETNLQ